MGALRLARRALGCFLGTALLLVAPCAPALAADGLLQGVSGDVETRYSFFSVRTKDDGTGTTKGETSVYTAISNLRLNHDLLPKLNLNAGLNYEKDYSTPSGDLGSDNTEITRIRPYVWLNLRDPVLGSSLGYDLRDETAKSGGHTILSLTQETYNASLAWRPTDLPATHVRYTRTLTHDDDRDVVDRTQDYVYLKSEYFYRGLSAYYTGTYIGTDDDLNRSETTQLSHEGKLIYSTTLMDGRVSLTSDNRIRYATFENTTERPLPAVGGLSALDDTPLDEPLSANPALVDGDRTTGAGVNLGFPGPGGDFRRRNVGLDFQVAAQVNRLHVWVDGWGDASLPADISNFFSWDIYTSTDNNTWVFHATIPVAIFGPFDRRFQLNFPAVTTRYIKAVTRPLPGGVIGSTNSSLFPTILVTEVEGFVTTGPQRTKRKDDQTTQNYTFDLRVILLRAPSLYYNFNGYYYEFDPGSDRRYNMSNGLFLNHRLSPILTTSANASFEWGRERDETRSAILYYASLAATPLRTLTDSLVFSGWQQWVGGLLSTSNSAVLYNTAQLYRGADVSLNLGAAFSSDEQEDGGTQRRRDLYLNVGTGIAPHPALTLTTYYLGKLSHRTGGDDGASGNTTEHRLDLALSLTPVRTLTLTAAASIYHRTDEDTEINQSYGLSWAPFPDGNLQFSFAYTENYYPDSSRLVQPSVRWYLSSRRRSYLEASYQFNASDVGSTETRSHVISTGLKVYF